MTKRGYHIVLHGAESTGKSTLAAALALHYDTVAVPEYGRIYCEEHGTDLKPADLDAIFAGQRTMTQRMAPASLWLRFSDTDALMTQAWSVMLFGSRRPAIDAWNDVGDLYLVPALDLPWEDDGTRLFGTATQRFRFMEAAMFELERRGLPHVVIKGAGADRLDAAIEAIDDFLAAAVRREQGEAVPGAGDPQP